MTVASTSPESTRRLGELLGRELARGDVVVLDGELGAGKTTFTQGVARGMGIPEQVTSPTFVVAREMPEGTTGTPLLHVDAYRIGSLYEWDDLDLDLAEFATVVEWGQQIAQALPTDRLEVRIEGQGPSRQLEYTAYGPRARELLAVVDVEA